MLTQTKLLIFYRHFWNNSLLWGFWPIANKRRLFLNTPWSRSWARDFTWAILFNLCKSLWGSLLVFYCYNSLPQMQWLKTIQINFLAGLDIRSQKSVSKRLKSRCWQACFPSGDSRGELVSLPFLASRGRLYSSACVPLSPSSRHITPTLLPFLYLLSLWFFCFPLMWILGLHWPTWMIQDNIISPSQDL